MALDLVDGYDTARTRLQMVRPQPMPFPPEPLRTLGIKWTTTSLQRADAKGGKLWVGSIPSDISDRLFEAVMDVSTESGGPPGLVSRRIRRSFC